MIDWICRGLLAACVVIGGSVAYADSTLALAPPDPVTPFYRYDAGSNVTTSGGSVTGWDDDGNGTSPSARPWSAFSGTTVNSVTTPSSITSTLRFDGSGPATTTSFGSAFTDADGTFELWVSPSALSTQTVWESGGTTNGAAIQFNSDGTFTFLTRQNNANFDVTSGRSLSASELSEFVQVVGVVDTAANQTRIYMDGVLEGTVAGTQDWTTGSDAAGLGGIISQGGAGTSPNSFIGDIALARFYDEALTDQQIFDLYEQISTVPLSPEPASMMLFGLAVVLGGGLAWRRRRRK